MLQVNKYKIIFLILPTFKKLNLLQVRIQNLEVFKFDYKGYAYITLKSEDDLKKALEKNLDIFLERKIKIVKAIS